MLAASRALTGRRLQAALLRVALRAREPVRPRSTAAGEGASSSGRTLGLAVFGTMVRAPPGPRQSDWGSGRGTQRRVERVPVRTISED